MNDYNISEKNLTQWKNDPITKEVFKVFSRERHLTQGYMLNGELMLGKDGQIQYARCQGTLDAIEYLLNINIDNFYEINEEN